MTAKRITSLLLILALLSTMVFALSSCMGEDPDEDTMEYLLRQGRKSLNLGSGSMAYNFFRRALSIEPNNQEALYGFVLSLDLRIFAFIDGTIDLLAGVFVFEPSLDDCEVACARLAECDLMGEAWTNPEDCLEDCPFGLQPFMFDTLSDGSSCYQIRDFGLEWIIPTTPENCELLCKDLDACGLINPPMTFTVQECIDHCPYSYVERHSKCYMNHLGECNGNDRTCFEHITVGLQLLFREIGLFIPPKTVFFADKVLDSVPADYQYYLKNYDWTLVEPPITIEVDGRYDHGFMYVSQALAHGFQSILLWATAVNLEMNFPSFDINFNYGNPQGIGEILDALIRVIEILLYDPIFPLGFQIVDEPWAYAQLVDGAVEMGSAFGSTALALQYALDDHDKQPGKAWGYNDDNSNFIWDEDETLTLRGLDLTISYDFAVAWVAFSKAVEANLVNREPIDISLLGDVLVALNLEDIAFITDLLAAWYPDGQLDISKALYEPDKNNMRYFLEGLLEKLRIIRDMV